MARLSNKQKIFIDEYFICGLNATEAVVRAGYKVKSRSVAASIGAENLRKVHVRDEIERRLDESAMSANEVIFRLSEHARGDHDDVLDKYGRPDIKRIRERGKTHLIKRFEYDRIEMTDKNGQDQTIIRYKVELHDAQSALVQLGRYHKLFTDKILVMTAEDEAIIGIRSGEIDYEFLSEAFGYELANELFQKAGVKVT